MTCGCHSLVMLWPRKLCAVRELRKLFDIQAAAVFRHGGAEGEATGEDDATVLQVESAPRHQGSCSSMDVMDFPQLPELQVEPAALQSKAEMEWDRWQRYIPDVPAFFCKGPGLTKFDVLQCWSKLRGEYPTMHATVRCVLAATINSAGCERTFSKARVLVSYLRTRLTTLLIQRLSFLNNNAAYIPDLDQVAPLTPSERAQADME